MVPSTIVIVDSDELKEYFASSFSSLSPDLNDLGRSSKSEKHETMGLGKNRQKQSTMHWKKAKRFYLSEI